MWYTIITMKADKNSFDLYHEKIDMQVKSQIWKDWPFFKRSNSVSVSCERLRLTNTFTNNDVNRNVSASLFQLENSEHKIFACVPSSEIIWISYLALKIASCVKILIKIHLNIRAEYKNAILTLSHLHVEYHQRNNYF